MINRSLFLHSSNLCEIGFVKDLLFRIGVNYRNRQKTKKNSQFKFFQKKSIIKGSNERVCVKVTEREENVRLYNPYSVVR